MTFTNAEKNIKILNTSPVSPCICIPAPQSPSSWWPWPTSAPVWGLLALLGLSDLVAVPLPHGWRASFLLLLLVLSTSLPAGLTLRSLFLLPLLPCVLFNLLSYHQRFVWILETLQLKHLKCSQSFNNKKFFRACTQCNKKRVVNYLIFGSIFHLENFGIRLGPCGSMECSPCSSCLFFIFILQNGQNESHIFLTIPLLS